LKAGLQLKLAQHLTLTPQLQQSIRLLQLSTLELQQEIATALAENPLLELAEPEGDEPGNTESLVESLDALVEPAERELVLDGSDALTAYAVEESVSGIEPVGGAPDVAVLDGPVETPMRRVLISRNGAVRAPAASMTMTRRSMHSVLRP
jgi:RNA polymerase sigma-54 factor